MAEASRPTPRRWPSGKQHLVRALFSLGLAVSLAGPGLADGHMDSDRPPVPDLATSAAAPSPAPLIALDSAAGLDLLLQRITLRADYAGLAQWFETQAHLTYCGVASSVIVLNSLALPAPVAENLSPYHLWTQTNLFAAPASARLVTAAQVLGQGMSLEQLQGLLASQGALVRQYHGDSLSLRQFRQLLQRGLANPADRLLANYDRRALGQAGGGHISPLAAYDPRSDRVLILDVARYRYPAVWVATADLWRAVRTVDRSSGRSRGLLTIQAGPPPPETSWPPGPNESEPPAPAQRPGSASLAPHR